MTRKSGKIIDEKFLPVYIDQDSRPDISQRYERWGWPATIIFNSDGAEIVKLRGFYSPQFFIPILDATIEDPSPVDYGQLAGAEREASKTLSINSDKRAFFIRFLGEAYDEIHGGWGTRSKFVDGPTLNYALEQSRFVPLMDHRARETVTRLIRMIDPDTRRVSQISPQLDWSTPLREYPMFTQEAALKAFSLAYARWGDISFKNSADRVFGFLQDYLSAPEGGFYTSMGQESFNPGIDKSRYSRENGQAIAAIAAYYDATGNQDALQLALRSAHWIINNRALGEGGFRHDQNDVGGSLPGRYPGHGAIFSGAVPIHWWSGMVNTRDRCGEVHRAASSLTPPPVGLLRLLSRPNPFSVKQ